MVRWGGGQNLSDLSVKKLVFFYWRPTGLWRWKCIFFLNSIMSLWIFFLNIAHFINLTEIQLICKLGFGKVLWNWLEQILNSDPDYQAHPRPPPYNWWKSKKFNYTLFTSFLLNWIYIAEMTSVECTLLAYHNSRFCHLHLEFSLVLRKWMICTTVL